MPALVNSGSSNVDTLVDLYGVLSWFGDVLTWPLMYCCVYKGQGYDRTGYDHPDNPSDLAPQRLRWKDIIIMCPERAHGVRMTAGRVMDKVYRQEDKHLISQCGLSLYGHTVLYDYT